MQCEKVSCSAPATLRVTLNAANEHAAWWACAAHAADFAEWVAQEATRRGGTWGALITVADAGVSGAPEQSARAGEA